ncbi:MAG: hypothetical protein EAX96_14845 [Candidatus Lokiarchaeota archaeon]|nr:hypothetical protein [Candidatus Lokiarchaeota archaeon]
MTQVLSEEFYQELISRNQGIFSVEQQDKLRNARICVIGVGGIGSPVVEILARTGIEHFTICDKDRFEISNMNRQTFAYTDTVGNRKIDATEHYLKKINPAITVKKHDHVDEENVYEMIKDVNAVIMGADEVKACLTVYRKAREHHIPVLEGFAVPYANVQLFTGESMSWEETYCLGTQEREISSIGPKEEDNLRVQYLMKFGKLEGLINYYSGETIRDMIEHPSRYHFPNLCIWNFMSAPLIANETLKLLLDWGILIKSPRMIVFDPYAYRLMLYNLKTGQVKKL